MADARKRISKNASKILFEIICEDSFEGESIKSMLPSARRISKGKERVWEYIQSELMRRSDEAYDLTTLCSAWYYYLRKLASSNLLDLEEKGSSLERYLANNLGDRIGKGKGRKSVDGDHMPTISRQSTTDAHPHCSPQEVSLNNGLTNRLREVKREEHSDEADNRDDVDHVVPVVRVEPVEDEDPTRINKQSKPAVDGTSGAVGLRNDVQPRPSRYNTADTAPISRNNSTMSVSGYDADNEKGLIKRRRKELRKRGGEDRDKVVKIEEKEEKEEVVEENAEQEEKVDDEMEEEKEEEEKEEDVEDVDKRTMVENLKGMIENLRDHCVSLRVMGVIDASDMETIADSFENAAQSIANNIETH